MRRLTRFVAALAVATAAVLYLTRPWDNAELEPAVSEPTSVTAPRTTPAPTSPSAPSPGPYPTDSASIRRRSVPEDARPARVVGLSDGDSFDIEWLDVAADDRAFDEVRLMGIDAPEFSNCYGRESRDALSSIIDDNDLLVDVIEDEFDRFGRQVANVWFDDPIDGPQLVNLAMVRAGAALARSDGGEHAAWIREAQRAAGFEAAGLWQACVAGGATDVFILDLHEDAEGRDDQNENGEWIEIANAGSSGADLTGWQVRDESTFHRFSFPEGFTLAAGESVRIRSGFGTDTTTDLFWNESFPIWNNAGDTGYLINSDGLFVDTWTYPS